MKELNLESFIQQNLPFRLLQTRQREAIESVECIEPYRGHQQFRYWTDKGAFRTVYANGTRDNVYNNKESKYDLIWNPIEINIETKGYPIVDSVEVIYASPTVILIEIATLRYHVQIQDIQDHRETGAICIQIESFLKDVLDDRWGDEQTSYLYLSDYDCAEWEVFSTHSDKETIYLTLLKQIKENQ